MDDPDAQIFNDTMEALGLQKYVPFLTHHAGNSLDLIFYKNNLHIRHEDIQRQYISDHRAILVELKKEYSIPSAQQSHSGT